MSCHEDARLSAWVDGELAISEARDVETHVGSCAPCQELVAQLRSMSVGLSAQLAVDPGFIVRFRERRDALSVATWWTWRQLALRLVPLAAAVLVAAVASLWLAAPPDAPLQALEREALGAPVVFDSGPESVLSIAFEPFPQEIE